MHTLLASLAGCDWRAELRAVAQLSCFATARPTRVGLMGKPGNADAWVEALEAAGSHGIALWPENRKNVSVQPRNDLVGIGVPDAFSHLEDAIEILMKLEFGVCGLGSVFFDEWIEADYKRWAFSRGHIDHGWGCAFRGSGHDHLVSRRWLDFGPWRVIRRPNDTTFVQFHDLAITDPAEAYEIAKVGHERMGVSYTGGFIQQIEQWMLDDVPGIYTPSDKKLTRVIPAGTDVSQLNMLNAATARRYYRLRPGLPQPVERIAYVFVEEDRARAHLHELWLRELECWVSDERGTRRLDADYHPTPSPPDWVKTLGARD